jgi:phosphate-selective porin OprO/OprP
MNTAHMVRAAALVIVWLAGAKGVALAQPSRDAASPTAEGSAVRARVASGAGDGFQLQSADDTFQLRVRGLIQLDARFFVNDRAEQAADTFVLRRVRPIFEGTLFRFFDFRLMPDFGGGTTVLQDAYMDLRIRPFAKVRAGKQKQPFGIERLVSASALPFVERALPTTVAGNRDVGVTLYGDVLGNRMSYWAGVFNGVADGASADVDGRDGKDVVARVLVHPFRGSRHERVDGLGVAFAASYGTERGALVSPGLPIYRSSGQQVFFRYRVDGTSTGTVLADGTRYRLSAQAYFYSGRVGLLAEQVFSSQAVRRESAIGRMGTNSWQGMVTWVLTGERASLNGVTPSHDFEPSSGRLGAFELTARYHQLTADASAFPAFADPLSAARAARAWTGGVNWYLNRSVKLTADYEHTGYTGGGPAGDRPAEHDVLTRIQLAF